MTRKEQNKILDAKIESNVNQYKVDRMNTEISAFSNGDLNKYEFLKRIDLNYKPNALDKARFEFTPLGKTFSTGLDKTTQGYQEEGVAKILKYIRDGLRGGVRPPGPDDNNDDIIKNLKDLETKLKYSKLSNEEKDKIYKMLNKFKDNMKKDIDNFNKKSNDYLDILDNKISKLSNKLLKTEDTIKNNKGLTNAEKNEFQNKINELQNKINELALQRNSINNEYCSAVDKIKNNKGLTNDEKNEFQNKINELQNKINELTFQINSVNNEHRRAVDKIKKKMKIRGKK